MPVLTIATEGQDPAQQEGPVLCPFPADHHGEMNHQGGVLALLSTADTTIEAPCGLRPGSGSV